MLWTTAEFGTRVLSALDSSCPLRPDSSHHLADARTESERQSQQHRRQNHKNTQNRSPDFASFPRFLFKNVRRIGRPNSFVLRYDCKLVCNRVGLLLHTRHGNSNILGDFLVLNYTSGQDFQRVYVPISKCVGPGREHLEDAKWFLAVAQRHYQNRSHAQAPAGLGIHERVRLCVATQLNLSGLQACSRQTGCGLQPGPQVRSVGARGGTTLHLALSRQGNGGSGRPRRQTCLLDHFVENQIQSQIEGRRPTPVGDKGPSYFCQVALRFRRDQPTHISRCLLVPSWRSV